MENLVENKIIYGFRQDTSKLIRSFLNGETSWKQN